MLLGPQRGRDALDGVQLPQQRLHLRTVSDGHHPSGLAARYRHRHPVDHQQTLVGDRHGIRTRDCPRQDVAQPTRRHELVQPLPDAGPGQAEQSSRLVVDDVHATLRVEGDDALADAVQHRLAFLHERHDLRRFEAEGDTFDRPSQNQRRHDADDKGQCAVQDHGRDDLVEPRCNLGLEDPDRDLTDRPARAVADRYARVG